MASDILEIADNFWNLRGSFKIGGVIDIGTQASLVRLGNGNFIFLDAYTLSSGQRAEVDALTDGGEQVEAILNLHPFHTVHVTAMHERYPEARLYGTARHHSLFPDLPWDELCTEDPRLHALYAPDLEFSIPRGVDFISSNDNIHFSSVLAYHRASGTIHADDTLMFLRLPRLLRWWGLRDRLSFHPTLARALEKRAGAAQDFRDWAGEMIESWADAQNLCAAHSAALCAPEQGSRSINARISAALGRAERTLKKHERRYD